MILPVLRYPDKRLRTQAKTIKMVDDAIRSLAKDMFETMYAENGIGLAATQVNRHLRLIVMDVPESTKAYQKILDERNNHTDKKLTTDIRSSKLCLINPVIKESKGSTQSSEGCLSVPDFQADVKRYESVTISALDANGKSFNLTASGLLAICIQHEIDHLNGILFVDYLSKLKQQRLQGKINKQAKTIAI